MVAPAGAVPMCFVCPTRRLFWSAAATERATDFGEIGGRTPVGTLRNLFSNAHRGAVEIVGSFVSAAAWLAAPTPIPVPGNSNDHRFAAATSSSVSRAVVGQDQCR